MVRLVLVCLLAAVGCSEDGARGLPTLRFDRTQPFCADTAGACLQAGANIFEVRGLNVIHKRVPGEPLAVASILFDRDGLSADAKADHAQYLLMRFLSWWGSQDYYRDWDSQLEHIGATHWSGYASDYVYTGVSVPAANIDRAFHLLATTVLAPPIEFLTDDYLDSIKDGYRQGIEASSDEAAPAADGAGFALIADQHPYSLRSQLAELGNVNTGTLSSVRSKLFDRRRATVVVVGDIERARVEDLVTHELSSLPATADQRPSGSTVPALRAGPERVRVVTRERAPNWQIRGYFPTVSALDEARFAALQLGARALSQRLFDEVRDELGLTYNVRLDIANCRAAYGTLSLGTVQPVEAMRSVRENIERMASEGISDEELEGARATYLTQMLSDTQSAYGLAVALGDWALKAGDSALLDSHLSAIRDVSAADATSEIGSALSELRYGAAGPGAPLDEHVLFGEEADAGM